MTHSSNVFAEDRLLPKEEIIATYSTSLGGFTPNTPPRPPATPPKRCNSLQSDSTECSTKKRAPPSTWIRRSGVDLKVTLENLTLGSGYYGDVDHVERNENIFMLKNPGPTDDVIGFRNNSENYCRLLMSILMMMFLPVGGGDDDGGV